LIDIYTEQNDADRLVNFYHIHRKFLSSSPSVSCLFIWVFISQQNCHRQSFMKLKKQFSSEMFPSLRSLSSTKIH